MRKGLIIFFLSISSVLSSQTILTIEGQNYANGNSDWGGVVIPHLSRSTFTFRNNSITSVNATGYMLLAGDEVVDGANNNLDGAVITGNKLTWNGTPGAPITHGLFVGYNKNDVIKYNYLDKVPYGIVIKSGTDAGATMTYTAGGVAYNIFKNNKMGICLKGMNGLLIYNNTFYDNLSSDNTFIFVENNNDRNVPGPSIKTKIKNNIFYSTTQLVNIYVESGCETGFECDYNVYYCTAGTPMFNYLGASKTFAEWQALGFDTHSVVVNPNFYNPTELLPNVRLDYGTNLGTTWETGLSSSATWTLNSTSATMLQNGIWQVGARIYNAGSIIPYYISSVVENSSPTILEMTYSLSIVNIVPSASAFNVQVNSLIRTVSSVAIVSGKVRLTLASPVVYGDIITVTYSKPSNNPLQTNSGNLAASMTAQLVVNNCSNRNPMVTIISPGNGSSFTAPATITINANASDADGSISKVEFYDGSNILGEKTNTPFSISWNDVEAGNYLLTAVATDNFNSTTTSTEVEIHVHSSNEAGTELINLYPNPNTGYFTIEIIKPFQNESNEISIINFAGEKVYDGILLKKDINKQFDLHYIDSGIYILMIIGKEILFTKKFIKN